MPFDIAIDFGETTVTVAARGWKESVTTASAVACKGEKALAMGDEAHALRGRVPREMAIEYPIHRGQLAREKWLREWVKHLISQCAPNSRLKKASVLFTLPPTGTSALARALKEAAQACDIQDVCGVDRTLAACAGMGMDMESSDAVLCAVLEEGYCDAALVCLGRVQRRETVSGGLSEVDAAITELARRHHSLSIGPATATELRSQLAAARAIEGVKANALGLDLRSGFPAMKEIGSELGQEAALPVCDGLCECVRRAAAQASEEEDAELSQKPIMLMGTGASLPGLESRITEKTALACRMAGEDMGKGLMRFISEDGLKKFSVKL